MLPAEAAGSAPGRGRLAGRRVLVVGAGTRPSPEPDPPIGNGRAISVLAAREGAAVACADRDAGAAEATAALVRNEGQIAAVVLADVASPEACASVVVESAAALGGLDGLVLNVGIGLGRGMAGTSADQWDQAFAVNTRRTSWRPRPRCRCWSPVRRSCSSARRQASYVNAHPLVLDGGAASFG